MAKQTEKMLKLRWVYLHEASSFYFIVRYITQMAWIDEKQEAIAKIRMAIDTDVAARARIDANVGEAGISTEPEVVHLSAWAAPNNLKGLPPHWKFGSPEKPVNSCILETDMCAQGNPSFKEFDERLRDFLSLCLPDEAIRYEDPILVSLETL